MPVIETDLAERFDHGLFSLQAKVATKIFDEQGTLAVANAFPPAMLSRCMAQYLAIGGSATGTPLQGSNGDKRFMEPVSGRLQPAGDLCAAAADANVRDAAGQGFRDRQHDAGGFTACSQRSTSISITRICSEAPESKWVCRRTRLPCSSRWLKLTSKSGYRSDQGLAPRALFRRGRFAAPAPDPEPGQLPDVRLPPVPWRAAEPLEA